MFIGAYWDSRQETLQQSAERIALALRSLANVDERFTCWFAKGGKRKSATYKRVRVEADAIASALKTNNRDVDGSAIAELGYNVGLWNGVDSFPCSFNATCGGYSSFVKNSVVFQLPNDGNILESLEEATLRQMLLGMVAAFDPDIAVLTSNDYLDQMGGGAPWDAGGWLIYRRGVQNLEVNEPVGVLSVSN
jgi:hypothetical protein